MKNKYSILIIFFLLAIASPVFAISKDNKIYTAFQDILDREPTMGEYHFYIKGFESMDNVKKNLNKLDERDEVVASIYQQALKRNPREDETEILIKFVAPNNLIRQQLYESEERKLAIIDAYNKFLDRDPADGDLEFYVNTRSPFDKIKEVLNNSEERKTVLVKKYKIKNGVEPNPNEVAYMIENQITIDGVDEIKVLGIEYIEPTKKEGPIQITVFNDFECIYCGQFYQTIQKIKKSFGRKINLTIKHFPLSFHQEALKAAMAYECAGEQGSKDEMAKIIYQARIDEEMSKEKWKFEAQNLGLNSEQFNNCLDSDKYLEKIEADIQNGRGLNVAGTPTTLIEEEKILGNIDLNSFARKVRLEIIERQD